LKTWTHAEYTEAAGREIAAMAAAVRNADPATPVPTCPAWDLAELVVHTGAVHRWVTAMVRDLSDHRYDREEMDLGVPGEARDYAAWLEAGAAPLLAVLSERDPDAEMWTWGGDRQVRFWSRRQLHETVVHRADAEIALGVSPVIDEDVAADGVEEFFDLLPYARWRPLAEELKGDGETLSWQADSGAGWLVRLTPDGFAYERSNSPGQVTVRTAAAADLMLLTWRRRSFDDYAVEGDHKLLSWWSERSQI
jgi:uncharacterized protein (TIGR03083 family)